MPRVSKQVARKDYPNAGIKKGDTYYKWKFRYSPVNRSLTMPQAEQLTQSAYMQEWIPLNRDISEFDGEADDVDELVERARQLGDEQREKKDNMPEGLQDGDTGQLLEERAEECEELADSLENAKTELEQAQDADDDREAAIEAAMEAIRDCAQ